MRDQTRHKVNTWLNGIDGRVGLQLQKFIARSDKFSLLGGSSKDKPAHSQVEVVSKSDFIIDFSLAEASESLADLLIASTEGPNYILVGTTGHTPSQLEKWNVVAKQRAVMICPNTSLGVVVTATLARAARKLLDRAKDYDIEISETHHRMKKDAPSGTALYLASEVARVDAEHGLEELSLCFNRDAERQKNEIGIVSTRGGGVFGEHQVRFIGSNDEVAISHRAFNRELFAEGALLISEWLVQQKPKGLYSLQDMG